MLDAPDLADDFYLNLLDWSSQNILAVGLANCVYVWNAATSKVERLLETERDVPITSVSWMQRGTHLAIGLNDGVVLLYDVVKVS